MRRVKPVTGPFQDEYGEYFRVQLTKCFGAKIDREDVERVGKYNWCVSCESRGTKWYAIRWVMKEGKRTKVRMSHFVFDLPPGTLAPGECIDHDNDDGLDNRRKNLTRMSQIENMKKVPTWRGNKTVEAPCL